MWNEPTKERLSKVPALYGTENVPLPEKDIHLKFFIGNCTWYIAEYDGEDLFWGFCHLGDDLNAEWGYVSFKELKEINIKGIEIDCEKDEYFSIQKAAQIETIIKSSSWASPA